MDTEKFEFRKKNHIEQSLNTNNQVGVSPSDQVRLFHRALPEIDFDEITLDTEIFQGTSLASPIFISSMTAGHKEGEKINALLFEACHKKNWLVGVGSQRKELIDDKAALEWEGLRKKFPNLKVLGNIGIAQLIEFGVEGVLPLIENLKPVAFSVHLNALQEALQEEGTRNFKGGLKALHDLCARSSTPIIVKETGCGFTAQTLKELSQIKGLYAIDVAGFGGTHWGRIEGKRSQSEILQRASKTYANWGHTTAESIDCFLKNSGHTYGTKLWASGGIRSGLDIVTCLSMGSEMLGMAQPFIQAASKDLETLIKLMTSLEFETKVGLFCTGHLNPKACAKNGVWEWKKS